METRYYCPCCGYKGLDCKPYPNIPDDLMETRNKPAPYEDLWGWPSYEVCHCCGFEFGNDDSGIESDAGYTFEEYLFNWIKDENCRWLYEDEKPSGWSLDEQLAAAGLPPLTKKL